MSGRALLGAAFFGTAICSGVLTADDESAAGEPAARKLVVEQPLAPRPPPVLGAMAYDEESGRYVAPWGAQRALLTVDPALQRALEQELVAGKPVRGATVLLEVESGRLLALAGVSRGEVTEEAALLAFAPAASIFKVTSVAALLRAGVGVEESVCFSGGKRRLVPRHLLDDPKRDNRCTTLDDVLPFSLNAAVAKLVDQRLAAGALADEAKRFGFDRPLPFARPVEVSPANIPPDAFGQAKTAAGFGDVRMSALHGALVASVPANRGVLVFPRIIASTEGGELLPAVPPERVVSEEIARRLARMMARTVDEGTGVRAFAERGPALRTVDVAGKTGSLTSYDEGRDYSWFVGYAPVDRPRVVVATVIENDVALWYVRAPDVAKSALERYFARKGSASLAARANDEEVRTP